MWNSFRLQSEREKIHNRRRTSWKRRPGAREETKAKVKKKKLNGIIYRFLCVIFFSFISLRVCCIRVPLQFCHNFATNERALIAENRKNCEQSVCVSLRSTATEQQLSRFKWTISFIAPRYYEFI